MCKIYSYPTQVEFVSLCTCRCPGSELATLFENFVSNIKKIFLMRVDIQSRIWLCGRISNLLEIASLFSFKQLRIFHLAKLLEETDQQTTSLYLKTMLEYYGAIKKLIPYFCPIWLALFTKIKIHHLNRDIGSLFMRCPNMVTIISLRS